METVITNGDRPVGLMALIRGDVQDEMYALRDDVRSDVERIEQLTMGMQAADRETLVSMLRQIVEQPRAEEADLPIEQIVFNPDMDANHAHMPLLDVAVRARIPAWLHGEAGSGKSTAAQKVAERYGLPFRSISLCPTTSKSDLLGYRDANGRYNTTAFREVYEEGGVFLFDEIDNAHPSSLALINNALSNNVAEFPDEKVEKHPDAVVVAAANTIGRGATAQYVGRAVIDAATRDRFVFIPWDIDDRLEEQIITGKKKRERSIDVSEGGVPSAKEWLEEVRMNREMLSELGIKHLCSTRAAIFGSQLARLGMGRRWLRELCIFKGMAEHDRMKLERTGWR